jgi:hypothetical protein
MLVFLSASIRPIYRIKMRVWAFLLNAVAHTIFCLDLLLEGDQLNSKSKVNIVVNGGFKYWPVVIFRVINPFRLSQSEQRTSPKDQCITETEKGVLDDDVLMPCSGDQSTRGDLFDLMEWRRPRLKRALPGGDSLPFSLRGNK